MMTVSFLPVELRSLDKLRADVLVLAAFEDERPLRGLAGLVDWRTAGMLSRFLRRGHIAGSAGETVLFPPGTKAGAPTGIFLGLGESGRFDEARYEAIVEEAAVHLRKLKVKHVAMSLPGTPKKSIAVERAVDVLVDATLETVAQLTLFASSQERKDITEALKRRRGELDVAVGPAAIATRGDRQGGSE